jgi:hypothetical protein
LVDPAEVPQMKNDSTVEAVLYRKLSSIFGDEKSLGEVLALIPAS